MNPNCSISIMQFLKLVSLSSILKTSCSIREEFLPGLMGYTHLAICTLSHVVYAPQGLWDCLLSSEALSGRRKEEWELRREDTGERLWLCLRGNFWTAKDLHKGKNDLPSDGAHGCSGSRQCKVSSPCSAGEAWEVAGRELSSAPSNNKLLWPY